MYNQLKRTLLLVFAILFFTYALVDAKDIHIKVTSFNIEWFGCLNNGPTDKELQLANVIEMIQMMESDVVAIQEITSSYQYASVDTLVKYLGDDWGGEIIPISRSACYQNVGILYKKDYIEFDSGRILNQGINAEGNTYHYNWSNGRYPVLYNLNVVYEDEVVPLSFVNIHAKAFSDITSYTRRKGGSIGLKNILDGTEFSNKKTVIIGDFNDFLEGTITYAENDSPYKNFMDDSSNYKGITTYLKGPYGNTKQVVDNMVISKALFDNYVENSSLLEYGAVDNINNYYTTTSDHVPVSADFVFHFEDEEGDDPGTCENFLFEEDFLSGFGEFTNHSIYGYKDWFWREIFGACFSGYDDAQGANTDQEAWLISPALNLSNMKSISMSFEHALNYCTDSYRKENHHTLWFSTDYIEGNDPYTANWIRVNIPTMPSGYNWTFVPSGDINIPSSVFKDNVHFAFKYESDTEVAGYWEIRNLEINGMCLPTSVETEKESKLKFYTDADGIHLNLDKASDIQVFNIVGKPIYHARHTGKTHIPIKAKGLYILKINKQTFKFLIH